MKPNEIFNIDKAMTEGVDPRNFDSDEDYYNAQEADDLDLAKFGGDWDIPDEIAVLRNQLRRTESPYLRQQIERKIQRYEDIYYGEDDLEEDWQKVNKHDKTDGLSRKAVKAYRREHPGSKLQTAVTTKPSKLKKGSKSAKRRKSFCARMSGMKKAHASAKTKRDPNSPINKALRRWNCESVEQLQQMLESQINEIKQRLDPKCWKGKHKEGTKIKGGVRVNNCVPNEGVAEGAVPDYEAMFLKEFASAGGGTGGIATSMAVGNPAAGSLFGGSYTQKNSPFKKNKTKKSGMIKR